MVKNQQFVNNYLLLTWESEFTSRGKQDGLCNLFNTSSAFPGQRPLNLLPQWGDLWKPIAQRERLCTWHTCSIFALHTCTCSNLQFKIDLNLNLNSIYEYAMYKAQIQTLYRQSLNWPRVRLHTISCVAHVQCMLLERWCIVGLSSGGQKSPSYPQRRFTQGSVCINNLWTEMHYSLIMFG